MERAGFQGEPATKALESSGLGWDQRRTFNVCRDCRWAKLMESEAKHFVLGSKGVQQVRCHHRSSGGNIAYRRPFA